MIDQLISISQRPQLIALVFVLVGAIARALYIFRYRDKTPEVRDFPVFASLADEVGRVAEEGASIHVALGKGGLVGDEAMTSLAALQGLDSLMDLSAAYDTPPLITTADPTLYILAADRMRRAYTKLDSAMLYRPTFVQFTAVSPVVYAAKAATYLFDGGIGSNIMLGAFGQEVILVADAAERQGIHSVGGTVSMEGVSALYPMLSPEKLAIGEELFAGGALVTQRPTRWASLWAQHALRWLVVFGIIGTAILSILGLGGG